MPVEGTDEHSSPYSLASQAPLPSPAAAKVPKERHGEVALLCQRHTQGEAAALLGVSQATSWRILRCGIREPGGARR